MEGLYTMYRPHHIKGMMSPSYYIQHVLKQHIGMKHLGLYIMKNTVKAAFGHMTLYKSLPLNSDSPKLKVFPRAGSRD